MKKWIVLTGIVLSAVVLLTQVHTQKNIAEYVPGPGPMSPINLADEKGGEPMSHPVKSVAFYNEGPGPMTVTKG